MKKIFAFLYGSVALIQFVLHYLGWLGIILGIVAFFFQNWERGKELIIGGVLILGLKYLIGFVFLLTAGAVANKSDK